MKTINGYQVSIQDQAPVRVAAEGRSFWSVVRENILSTARWTSDSAAAVSGILEKHRPQEGVWHRF